jgi:predicted amidohydrolase YtcJ
MYADIAILAHSPIENPPTTVEEVAVATTIFNGKVVYEREPGAFCSSQIMDGVWIP